MTQSTTNDGSPRLHHKLGFGSVAIIVLVLAVLIPVAIGSVVTEVIEPPRFATFSISPPATPRGPAYSRLELDVTELDQWSGTVTMRVKGNHVCQAGCNWSDRATFFAIPASEDARATPLPEVINLPATSAEVTQEIKLPVAGDPIRYPFDSYRLELGVLIERVYDDSSVLAIPAEEAEGRLFVTLSSKLPLARTRLSRRLSPQELAADPGGNHYTAAARLVFSRPLYIQLLTVLLVLLIAVASAFAVFMRPVRELVTSAGALILGVWGIRSILIGQSLPGLSAVDLSLAMVILFLLVAIACREFFYMEGLAGNPLRRRLRKDDPPATDESDSTEETQPPDI